MLMPLQLHKYGRKKWQVKEECITLKMNNVQDVVKTSQCILTLHFCQKPMSQHRCGTMRLLIQDTILTIQDIQVALDIFHKLYGKDQLSLDVVFQEFMLHADTVMAQETMVTNSQKTFYLQEMHQIKHVKQLPAAQIIQAAQVAQAAQAALVVEVLSLI
jgi:hypothetical protein